MKTGKLLLGYFRRLCLVAIFTGIIILFYQHTKYVSKFNKANGVLVKEFTVSGLKGERKRDAQHGRVLHDPNIHQRDIAQQEREVVLPNVHQREIAKQGHEWNGLIVQQRDIAKQDFELNEPIAQRRDVAEHDQGPQYRHLNGMKVSEEVMFTSDEYPLSLNMSDILHQYDTKGYADKKPINTFDHRYIINPKHICTESDAVMVLFVVQSKPNHFERRSSIRETWGDRKRFQWMRTIFSSWTPKDDKTLLALQNESSLNNDVLVVNYPENYYSKIISGLRWALTYCTHALYIVSLEDDVYVAPDSLLSFLHKLPVRKTKQLYSGHLVTGTSPLRDKDGPLRQWYVSRYEYPYRSYPDYISGGFVLMSMSTVRKFTVASLYTKMFKFEDVYLGILATKVGIDARENEHVNSRKTVTASESFQTLIASRFYDDPVALGRAWECHLSVIDNDKGKAISCDYIGKRLQKLKSEIDNLVSWMEYVKHFS